MKMEIGAVFKRPNDRLWLLRLRRWITDNRSLFDKLDIKAAVTQFSDVEKLIGWRGQLPNERLAVTIGFGRREVEPCQKDGLSPGEPIIVADPYATDASHVATASFSERSVVVTCSDLTAQVRKSLIRAGLRKCIQIGMPKLDKELAGYFSLRYKVWKEVGFLRDKNRQPHTEWEIDFWDRSALPLYAVAQDGGIIGCARLIHSHGDDQPAYVSKIQRLLDRTNDAKLSELFQPPRIMQQPFDLLQEFPEYRPHFRVLIQSRTNMAEIGRVAVDPDHRGKCISEALVDTAVSCAEAQGTSCVFLACHETLAPLYARCGFKAVPGLRSEKFFNIQLPSIVMERRLKFASNQVAA
jgi:predicted GNAT family N-acyltransferase